jgi:UDP-hydrolysing UDP-N-acetyl-D-glucosamine 2-epimerase
VKKVAVVTGTRADYGLLRPTVAALHADDRFELQLLVPAMHLDERYGLTVGEIEADPWPITARVPIDAGEALGECVGAGASAFSDVMRTLAPDFVILLGDRHEMLSAALAAAGEHIPVVHLHGGELSEGSLDDVIRHCITKLAHLHLVAARAYGERICQLGEEPWRVHVVGAAGLESIVTLDLLERDALAAELGGIELGAPLVVLTLHPESLDPTSAHGLSAEVIAGVEQALDATATVVVTLPNDDPGNAPVREALLGLAERNPRVHAFPSVGQLRYLSLLGHADAVLGNSSSALLEAPAFELPAVNVGERQRGRIRAANVIDCRAESSAVADALTRALDPDFRASLAGMENPYGDGRVSERVLALLASAPSADELRNKRFYDLPGDWRDALELGSLHG